MVTSTAKDRWRVGQEQKQAVTLQFKFYPYYNKIRFRADIGSLAGRELAKRTAIMSWQETKEFSDRRKPDVTLAPQGGQQ